MKPPLLDVVDLHKTYVAHLHDGRRRPVLRGVNVAVEAGSCVVIRGESGSGKSSLLRCIYRSALPDSGSIVLRQDDAPIDLATAPERDVLDARRRTMAIATQFLTVVPRVSALDLVAAETGSRDAAVDLLERLGLRADLHDFAPATFSGGQRQMLNIALAIARPRALLLLDEVTASLDLARRELVTAALLERKRRGAALLAIFHDVPAGNDLVDGVLTLRDGLVAA